jgi:general secretion pathway protein C
MTQARMVPNFTPDRQVDGFRIFQIRPGSIFQKLGLRNGDVIQRVNGIKLDDPTKGLELFTALKNLSNFTIDLKRNNVNMTMTYTVK